MSEVLSVAVGLGLAAACGFRVFVPLLALGLAARADVLALAPRFEWLGDDTALLALGVATVLELLAYYVPWLDNLLDTVASPAAVVAGVVVTASVTTGMDPFLRWTLAVIAGGGIAGAVQATTVGGRVVSSLVTGGLGNPVVATMELAGAAIMSLLALVAPVVALILVGVLLLVVVRRRRRRRAVAA